MPNTAKFVSYLWGIETSFCFFSCQHSSKFVSYLWGIETGRWDLCQPLRKSFVSYLWGIETQVGFSLYRSNYAVCILPMRDWNPGKNDIVITGNGSSLYLTYEGLKQTSTAFFNFSGIGVCILPMRDWNFWFEMYRSTTGFVCILPMRDWNIYFISGGVFEWIWFVSYLWGIETHIISSKNGNLRFVCILPMRDWNSWNQALVSSLTYTSLYLTYEGLKLQ